MRKRIGELPLSADAYGRSLTGLGINLIVTSIEAARPFHTEVLGAEEVYSDPDFAAYRGYGADWLLHADHTYEDHPLSGSLRADIARGIGIELRLHGRDPDEAEAAARRLGYTVLAGAMGKAHGLREAFIVDQDGYVWVPDVPVN